METRTTKGDEDMKTKNLVYYIRHNGGNLTRHCEPGITTQEHADYYTVGPVTDREQLVGWPETLVIWHGHIGYCEEVKS